MQEMFYVMVKHGVSLLNYDLEVLEEMAGVSIDPQTLDFIKSVLYVDSMLGLIEQNPLINTVNKNIAGARFTFYIDQLIAKLGVDNKQVVVMQQLLSTNFPNWEIDDIEDQTAFAKSIDWKAIIELNVDQVESVISDYLAGRTPVMPEIIRVEAQEEKEGSASDSEIITAQPKKQSSYFTNDLHKLLVIIKKGLGIEAVRVEFVEQEDLFVKMYNSFTKIDNAAALSQLYELNHIEEMIQAELSGDVEELL